MVGRVQYCTILIGAMSLDQRHHALVQSLMCRGPATEASLRNLFHKICSEPRGDAEPQHDDGDSGEVSPVELVRLVVFSLNYSQFDVKRVHCVLVIRVV